MPRGDKSKYTDKQEILTMATNMTPVASDQTAGLPSLVLEARSRLGPDATPEDVTAHVRAQGVTEVTVDAVRQLWDEGHLPSR